VRTKQGDHAAAIAQRWQDRIAGLQEKVNAKRIPDNENRAHRTASEPGSLAPTKQWMFDAAMRKRPSIEPFLNRVRAYLGM
jgi:hypothetical protein